ncbi:MAG TPA: hypothetical protein VFY69_09900 [Solirubrobacterales bacterium]|nr:hypothetical protein [Solirubrobacterales bacterium]
MAFDEALADRICDDLASRPEVGERKMFGGIAFLIAGNMAVGVIGEDLMVLRCLQSRSKRRTSSEVGGEPMGPVAFVRVCRTKATRPTRR